VKNLISVEECLQAKDDVVFVDGSWYHKGTRNGRQDFEQGPRLPGARYIDMDDLSCQKELFPELNPKGLHHMLPPARLFALAMDEFGITKSDHVVVYGRNGSVFTPRTWFLFRSMGHVRVSLMQGSLEDWQDAGGPVEEGRKTVPHAAEILAKGGEPAYQANDPTNVVTMKNVLDALQQDAIILDPRGSSFHISGHIPGAIHIPYTSLVQQGNTLRLKPREDLLLLFADAGVEIRYKQDNHHVMRQRSLCLSHLIGTRGVW
jgi:thiosulfate/3-mercaptopyruvate sulfurtransferase